MELVDIRKASEALDVSINTLRRWDKQDKFKPFTRTSGGHRRYSRKQLKVAKAYSVKIEILAERSDTDMNEEMVNQ